MLRKIAAAALLLCALTTLSSCQPPREVFLINNTDSPLRVLYSAWRGNDYQGTVYTDPWPRRWYSWPFVIAPGVGRRIDYGPGRTWLLDVRVRGCRLSFVAPTTDLYDYEKWAETERYPYHTTIQIEPDGRLYVVGVPALAEGNKPKSVDVADFLELQPEGFPIEPTSRRCWWN